MSDKCVACGEIAEGKPLYKKLGSSDCQVEVFKALHEMELLSLPEKEKNNHYICWDCDETIAEEYATFISTEAKKKAVEAKRKQQDEARKIKLQKKLKQAFKKAHDDALKASGVAPPVSKYKMKEKEREENRYYASFCLLCKCPFEASKSRGYQRFTLQKMVDDELDVADVLVKMGLKLDITPDLKRKRFICCQCYNKIRRNYKAHSRGGVGSPLPLQLQEKNDPMSVFQRRPTAEEHAAEIAKLIPPSIANLYKVVTNEDGAEPVKTKPKLKSKKRSKSKERKLNGKFEAMRKGVSPKSTPTIRTLLPKRTSDVDHSVGGNSTSAVTSDGTKVIDFGICNLCGLGYNSRPKEFWFKLSHRMPSVMGVTVLKALQILDSDLADVSPNVREKELVCKPCFSRVCKGFRSQILRTIADKKGIDVTKLELSKIKVKVNESFFNSDNSDLDQSLIQEQKKLNGTITNNNNNNNYIEPKVHKNSSNKKSIPPHRRPRPKCKRNISPNKGKINCSEKSSGNGYKSNENHQPGLNNIHKHGVKAPLEKCKKMSKTLTSDNSFHMTEKCYVFKRCKKTFHKILNSLQSELELINLINDSRHLRYKGKVVLLSSVTVDVANLNGILSKSELAENVGIRLELYKDLYQFSNFRRNLKSKKDWTKCAICQKEDLSVDKTTRWLEDPVAPPNLMVPLRWAYLSIATSPPNSKINFAVDDGKVCENCHGSLKKNFGDFVGSRVASSHGLSSEKVVLEKYKVSFDSVAMNIVADPLQASSTNKGKVKKQEMQNINKSPRPKSEKLTSTECPKENDTNENTDPNIQENGRANTTETISKEKDSSSNAQANSEVDTKVANNSSVNQNCSNDETLINNNSNDTNLPTDSNKTLSRHQSEEGPEDDTLSMDLQLSDSESEAEQDKKKCPASDKISGENNAKDTAFSSETTKSHNHIDQEQNGEDLCATKSSNKETCTNLKEPESDNLSILNKKEQDENPKETNKSSEEPESEDLNILSKKDQDKNAKETSNSSKEPESNDFGNSNEEDLDKNPKEASNSSREPQNNDFDFGNSNEEDLDKNPKETSNSSTNKGSSKEHESNDLGILNKESQNIDPKETSNSSKDPESNDLNILNGKEQNIDSKEIRNNSKEPKSIDLGILNERDQHIDSTKENVVEKQSENKEEKSTKTSDDEEEPLGNHGDNVSPSPTVYDKSSKNKNLCNNTESLVLNLSTSSEEDEEVSEKEKQNKVSEEIEVQNTILKEKDQVTESENEVQNVSEVKGQLENSKSEGVVSCLQNTNTEEKEHINTNSKLTANGKNISQSRENTLDVLSTCTLEDEDVMIIDESSKKEQVISNKRKISDTSFTDENTSKKKCLEEKQTSDLQKTQEVQELCQSLADPENSPNCESNTELVNGVEEIDEVSEQSDDLQLRYKPLELSLNKGTNSQKQSNKYTKESPSYPKQKPNENEFEQETRLGEMQNDIGIAKQTTSKEFYTKNNEKSSLSKSASTSTVPVSLKRKSISDDEFEPRLVLSSLSPHLMATVNEEETELGEDNVAPFAQRKKFKNKNQNGDTPQISEKQALQYCVDDIWNTIQSICLDDLIIEGIENPLKSSQYTIGLLFAFNDLRNHLGASVEDLVLWIEKLMPIEMKDKGLKPSMLKFTNYLRCTTARGENVNSKILKQALPKELFCISKVVTANGSEDKKNSGKCYIEDIADPLREVKNPKWEDFLKPVNLDNLIAGKPSRVSWNDFNNGLLYALWKVNKLMNYDNNNYINWLSLTSTAVLKYKDYMAMSKAVVAIDKHLQNYPEEINRLIAPVVVRSNKGETSPSSKDKSNSATCSGEKGSTVVEGDMLVEKEVSKPMNSSSNENSISNVTSDNCYVNKNR
ncbi:hypothetical protein Anas_07912 [Armadillidium nasatum]|uniref:Uncharacterized protein n=1 Tax=Armadillidium nasatum TaxID=96803 RepID=A0A5N5SVH3_9CRUS|nr:hypothetical protein Anas_07912 [Armadillidium nasatum]